MPDNAAGNTAPPASAPTPAPAPAPQPTHPDFTQPPAVPGESRVRPVWVDPDAWVKTNEEVRELRAWRAEQERKAEQDTADRQRQEAQKGGYEKALTEANEIWQKRYEALEKTKADREQRWLEEKKLAAINEVLTGRQFVGPDPGETARMVRQLLESEVEAIMLDSGEPHVRDRKTFRTAVEYLNERINSPGFSVFFTPTNRGGAGTDGTRTTGPPQLQHPGSVEAIAARYRESITSGVGLKRIS